MNRRDLLRELSRVQATWVNRNTPGAGDVDITAEGEQDYLNRISAVFERAREDVRRKRTRAVTAARALAAIDALMLKYDPNQPRDRRGRWTDRNPGDEGPDAPKPKSKGGGTKDKPKKSAPARSSGKDSTPVAKPRPKPEPAKERTPDETLAAAPKQVDGTGSRKIDRAGTAALERYRGKDFTTINGALRGTGEGKPPAWVNGVVEKIDAVHAESKLNEDVVLSRGIGDVERVFGPAAKRNLTGAEWKDDAFQSTTADPDVAERFMFGGEGARTAAVLKIRAPKGTGAIQLSDSRYEAEMLLERGLRMRVISDSGPWRRGQKKPRTIEVEVVPA